MGGMGSMSGTRSFLMMMALGAGAPAQESPEPAALPPDRAPTEEQSVEPMTPAEFARKLEADGIELDLPRKEVRVRGDLLRRRRSREYPIEYGIVVEGGFTHEAFGLVKCT